MFEKLFKPKIEHQDPNVRLSAIKELRGDKALEPLSGLALNDNDSQVRKQAMSQLEKILTEHSTLDSKTAAKLFSVSNQPSIKEKLVPQITGNDELLLLVESLEDEKSLILFAANSLIPTARKLASEKIVSLECLKQLQQKSTDKNVLQIVRQKIQIIKAKNKDKQNIRDKLNQVCEAVERLAKNNFEPMLVNRVHLLEAHWKEIDDKYKADYTNRYQSALLACHETINLAKEQAALEEFQIAQNQICQSLSQAFEDEIATTGISTTHRWKKKKENLEHQWQEVCRNFTPEIEISERFHILKSAAEKLDSVIEKYSSLIEVAESEAEQRQTFEALSRLEKSHFGLSQQLSWPFSINTPALYGQIRVQHDELKQQLRLEQKKHREQQAEVDKKVTIFKNHIRQKNLIKANRLFNYIHNLLNEFPKSLQQKEQQKLETVTQSLNELRELNKFVTQPKKEMLCGDMEALIGSQLQPEELMQQIKTIQNRWKLLVTSDALADDILWDRFKQASDTAYQPCAIYLGELEVIKHENLETRKQLSQQVELELSQLDWQHADWKKIQTDYNQTWKQWHSISPVFFAENKPVQQYFESLMNQTKEKLNQEKIENHAVYDQLTDRIAVLVESLQDDNIDDAIEQIKRLQASWKNVGITHLNKSRKQWNKFRKRCDQVFDYQREKHKTQLAQQDQQADQAYKIIDQIKLLKTLPDDQLPASQADYQNLKQQFGEAADLPGNREERIVKRFRQVCEEYESHLAGLSQRSRSYSHDQVRKAAALCSNIETLVVSGQDQQRFNALKTEFELIQDIPDKIHKQLYTRLEQAEQVLSGRDNYSVQSLTDNEQSLSELAIKLEVLLDLESPESARRQRMNYQLEQLQAGLKPALSQQEKLTQLIDVELNWYTVGAVSIEARKMLETRLAAIIKQAET